MVGLTVTDGTRDPDGSASDAAVVVQRSRVRRTGNRLNGRPGGPGPAPTVLVGNSGAAGRVSADVDLVDAGIIRNSRPGVAPPLCGRARGRRAA